MPVVLEIATLLMYIKSRPLHSKRFHLFQYEKIRLDMATLPSTGIRTLLIAAYNRNAAYNVMAGRVYGLDSAMRLMVLAFLYIGCALSFMGLLGIMLVLLD